MKLISFLLFELDESSAKWNTIYKGHVLCVHRVLILAVMMFYCRQKISSSFCELLVKSVTSFSPAKKVSILWVVCLVYSLEAKTRLATIEKLLCTHIFCVHLSLLSTSDFRTPKIDSSSDSNMARFFLLHTPYLLERFKTS